MPPSAPTLADAFLRLACLDYSGWHRSNPAKALRLLADFPAVAHANIYCAAAVGDVAAVGAFVEADRGARDRMGGPYDWEPLLYACYSRLEDAVPGGSTLDVARLLLARGANPNAGFLWDGLYAFTALTGAFGRGEDWTNQPPHPREQELARALLEAGANPNDSQTLYNRHFAPDDSYLRLLFEYGLGRGDGEPWLSRMTDPRAVSKLLEVELCAAAQHGYVDRVRLLVEHGVDVNAAGSRNRRTPYEEAVGGGHEAIAEYLVGAGARRIPLSPEESFVYACILGQRDEVKRRLDADPGLLARLDRTTRVGAMHHAVEGRQADGVRLLAELGFDVNGLIPHSGFDRAPLHAAASMGDLEMVTLLLDLGADPHLRDPTHNGAAIGWAGHSQQHHVVRFLMPRASIFDAICWDGVEHVAELLDATPSLCDARDAAGRPLTAFLHPEMTRLDDMLNVLVARGVNLNVRDAEGRTLLDRAAARGLNEFAAVLRAHGARQAGAATSPS